MDGHIMRCGTIGSCQSAATSQIVKALLVMSLTHVSGAVTSVLTFTVTFIYSFFYYSTVQNMTTNFVAPKVVQY